MINYFSLQEHLITFLFIFCFMFVEIYNSKSSVFDLFTTLVQLFYYFSNSVVSYMRSNEYSKE